MPRVGIAWRVAMVSGSCIARLRLAAFAATVVVAEMRVEASRQQKRRTREVRGDDWFACHS